jgi:hypothetical protein
MNRNLNYDRESFINEIKRAMDNVPIEEIRSALGSITKRIRRVETIRGAYLKKKPKKIKKKQ